jgi:proline dehydrogenase
MSVFGRFLGATLPLVPSPIIRTVARRYVAGETLDDAFAAVSGLNREGASATLDVLGEDVTRREETRYFVDEYKRALAGIAERRLDSSVP